MRRLFCLLAMAALVGLAGCASIVSDNDSTTYIETIPEKCRCTLHGQDFKRVVFTPDSINLPSDAAPLTVMCEADNYQATSVELDTKMDGWVFGNILFGGVIGAVVDAGRGAGQKYPPKLTVQLDPVYFASEMKRDDYYAMRVKVAKDQFEAERKRIERRYRDDSQRSAKERKLTALDKEESEVMVRLETNRINSVIGTPPPPQELAEHTTASQ